MNLYGKIKIGYSMLVYVNKEHHVEDIKLMKD